MIGLDTSVLVRYAVQDDPEQSASATAIIEELDEDAPGFVSLVVVAELSWVLRRAYRADDEAISAVIRTLLDAVEIVVQESDAVRRALERTAGGAAFADALIAEIGHRAGCTHTVTVDRAGRRAAAAHAADRTMITDDRSYGWRMDLMAETNALTVADLRDRGSLKSSGTAPGVIAAWVAEMDLPLAPAISAALHSAVDASLTGYLPRYLDRAVGAATAALQAGYGWQIDPADVHLVASA